MRSVLKLTTALALGLFTAGSAVAEDVALVIANSTYDNASRLRDAERDLRDLLRAYDRDGYSVISGRNLNSADMADILQEFEVEAADADRVIIHFSGYVADSGMNLRLATRDMDRSSLVGMHYSMPSMDLIYELVDHRPGRAAVLLGTPQNGVPAALEAGPHIPQGVLVMSGEPRAFNRMIASQFLGDNKSAAEIAKSTRGMVVTGYVSDQSMSASADTTSAVETGSVSEMRLWRAAAQNGGREALEGYLKSYPNGLFASEARSRIAALGPVKSPEQTLEEALKLTRDQRRAIQKDLTLLGFDTRGVDGIFGSGTRRAVQAWQRSLGFRDSGYLDRSQIRVMSISAKSRQAELDAQAEAERAERDRQDLAFWQRTGATGGETELREYLNRFPEGLFAPQAKRELDAIQASKPKADPRFIARENSLNLNTRTRRLVEQRLDGLGLEPGPIDGKFDAATRKAIAKFQEQRRMAPTGYLTSEAVGLLIISVFGK